jgi:hypothetical protein
MSDAVARPTRIRRKASAQVAKVQLLSHSLGAPVRPTDVGKNSVDPTDALWPPLTPNGTSNRDASARIGASWATL